MPRRDYAGTVLHGLTAWIGVEVWGTGGEIGHSIDGSRAERSPCRLRRPQTQAQIVSLEQAGAIGVTFLDAWLGLMECARLDPGETLLVSGGVGGAAAQIRKWRGSAPHRG